ncbi:hypothetical protein GCM10022252_33960 [Streptosporangium oxazolinicum]|uniref:Uncharacterized protein n=1 Tax=Streptosporangium oxazolinicum TaxID=909287 RepID=A0ABP8AXG5_9ACTN
MFKQALVAGTLAASTLIVGMAVSAQPAGASAATQQVSVVTGRDIYDPFNPFGFYPRYAPFGFYNNYVPFGFQSFYRPVVFQHW